MAAQNNVEDLPPRPILKPWGWEIEIWNSSRLGIKYLNISAGKSTSLHCHPNKRTGYVVLKGEVEVEFLAGTKRYKAGDRVNFRPSLFHRSTAIINEAILFELESPPNKEDLVRLEDTNHRSGSEYEKVNAKITVSSELILQSIKASLNHSGPTLRDVCSLGVSMSMPSITPTQMLAKYEEHVIVSPVNASITTIPGNNDSKCDAIVQPGDVTTIGHLRRMSKILNMNSMITALLVNFRKK
jgi:mannose-6-phosphate isomerase-like protein (cupin superfamily)